jgi:hypothetical protein
MFSYLILAVALAIAAYLFIGALGQGSPSMVARFVRWLLIAGGAFLTLVFILSGRWSLVILALIMTLLGLLARGMGAASPGGWAGAGGRRGKGSNVRTEFLDLHLDHGSGTVSGTILKGRFEGRSVEDLSLEQLLELLAECQAADERSAQVLAAYLDREHPDWRAHAGAAGAAAAGGGMTREEAFETLGLEPGASDDQIRAAYRKLMAEHHPDRGGDPGMAARLNQAKDLLLGT